MPAELAQLFKALVGIAVITGLTVAANHAFTSAKWRRRPWFIRGLPVAIPIVGILVLALIIFPVSTPAVPIQPSTGTVPPTVMPPVTPATEGKGPGIIPVERLRGGWDKAYIVAGIALLLIGFGVALAPPVKARRIGLVTAISGVGLISAEELVGIKFQLDPQFALAVGRPFALHLAGQIGPFVVAQDSLLTAPEGDSAFRRVVRSIDSVAGRGELEFVMLLGGADKRPLRGAAQRRFGSNEGLAQARARWLSRALTKAIRRLGDDSVSVMTWASGATHFGTTVDSTLLKDDRRVTVLLAIKPRWW